MKTLPSKNHSRGLRFIYLILFIFVILAFYGIFTRWSTYKAQVQQAEKGNLHAIEARWVKKGPLAEKIILPGTVQPWHQATIYARVNGYLKSWYRDIGREVKEGELLAEIETPELDAELRQTEAQLKTAEANYKLAQISANRWKNLLKTQSVSQQETDERVLHEAAQAEIVAATRANRDRLLDLVNFKRVVAPFDGTITARHTDIGKLIDAGSTGKVPLFQMTQSKYLRAYIKVPQNYSSRLKGAFKITLMSPQDPQKLYSAELINTAKAIDPMTRTLLTQFKVENPENTLLSGSYIEAHFNLSPQKNTVIVPVNALIFRAEGLEVAVLSDENKALLKSIVVGRDNGNEVEVLKGLQVGEKIILSPPDDLNEGESVRVIALS